MGKEDTMSDMSRRDFMRSSGAFAAALAEAKERKIVRAHGVSSHNIGARSAALVAGDCII